MKTRDRDINSYTAIIDSFIDRAAMPKEEAELIKKELHIYIQTKFSKNKWMHPEITKFCTDWYREFYRLVGGTDPYLELKKKSNEMAERVVKKLDVSGWQESLACSILGNKLDYGAVLVHQCDLAEIEGEFQKLRDFKLDIDDTRVLQEKLGTAKKVLFLVDNCGEIIFDTFLLERIAAKVGKENVWIMAKESPMLNDATTEDLRKWGLGEYGKLISTGSNCFGLHAEDVSEECKQMLKEADLIIAKGQAYLEFFTEYNFDNVINILIVKYPIVNPAFGILPSGHRVVMSSERYAQFGKEYFGKNIKKITDFADAFFP